MSDAEKDTLALAADEIFARAGRIHAYLCERPDSAGETAAAQRIMRSAALLADLLRNREMIELFTY